MYKCENCYWRDKCDAGEVCEEYFPICEEDQDEMDAAEYIMDLKNRQRTYMEEIYKMED